MGLPAEAVGGDKRLFGAVDIIPVEPDAPELAEGPAELPAQCLALASIDRPEEIAIDAVRDGVYRLALRMLWHTEDAEDATQEAFLAIFLFFFPAIILSGFLYPVDTMPAVFQRLTLLNPLRHFLEIVRGIFLKGVGPHALWVQYGALLGMAALEDPPRPDVARGGAD